MSDQPETAAALLKRLQATERGNRRLREMMRSLGETLGRAVLRVEMGTTEDERPQFTITSSAGAEMEKMKAAIMGGVVMALNHHWKAGEAEDENIGGTPEEGETP